MALSVVACVVAGLLALAVEPCKTLLAKCRSLDIPDAAKLDAENPARGNGSDNLALGETFNRGVFGGKNGLAQIWNVSAAKVVW